MVDGINPANQEKINEFIRKNPKYTLYKPDAVWEIMFKSGAIDKKVSELFPQQFFGTGQHETKEGNEIFGLSLSEKK